MKSAVYTKAGQVGIEEIKRPSIQESDDVIIRVVQMIYHRRHLLIC